MELSSNDLGAAPRDDYDLFGGVVSQVSGSSGLTPEGFLRLLEIESLGHGPSRLHFVLIRSVAFVDKAMGGSDHLGCTVELTEASRI